MRDTGAESVLTNKCDRAPVSLKANKHDYLSSRSGRRFGSISFPLHSPSQRAPSGETSPAQRERCVLKGKLESTKGLGKEKEK